jgi:hypothetical protein
VCDNFCRGAAGALPQTKEGNHDDMIQELEQEYTPLTTKVRELREYL